MAKPKIFVSHSSFDTAFATKLVNDLNAAGAQAWMDVNDLGAGNFQENISKALADCEWFLLVLTPNALASDWVRMEVDAAIRLKHQRQVKGLIFIKATNVDNAALPALWGVFNIFDATGDYARVLDKVVREIGLPVEKNQLPLAANAAIKNPTDEPKKPNVSLLWFDSDIDSAESLLRNKQYDEALKIFDRVIEAISAIRTENQGGIFGDAFFPNLYRSVYKRAWEGKSKALFGLGHPIEAVQAKSRAMRGLTE